MMDVQSRRWESKRHGSRERRRGRGEVGPEPTKLPYEDGEGHDETDAPEKRAPVNSGPLTGRQREGHTGGEQLPQWRPWCLGLRTGTW